MVVGGPPVAAKVLLVDDEVEHLVLRAEVMKTYGFSTVTTSDPLETIAIVAKVKERIDVAVLDYDMPLMNGCRLANRLRSIYPELKIILYSGAVEAPTDDMTSVDTFVSKSDGMDALLKQIANFVQGVSRPSRVVSRKTRVASSGLHS